MPNQSLFQKSLAKGYALYSDDVGKALIHMGTIGWACSALAQIAMIAKNDKISKKDKKFLIPQEAADGVVNVGLYYTICMGLKKYGDKLCEKGELLLRSTDKTIGKIMVNEPTLQEYVEGKAQALFRNDKITSVEEKNALSTIYEKIISEIENIKYVKNKPKFEKMLFITPDSFELVKTKEARNLLIDEFKKAQSDFKSYKNGIGVIATIGGSVLACNLITPICRNIVANQFQKKYIKNKPSQKNYLKVVPTTYNAFKI